ncbi:unnamed protein product, partial [Gadus morhua 'NCC']
INYVLDPKRPGEELIVKHMPTCLSRSNFLTLGLQTDIDSMVGNACLSLVQKMGNMQGCCTAHRCGILDREHGSGF